MGCFVLATHPEREKMSSRRIRNTVGLIILKTRRLATLGLSAIMLGATV